MKNTKYLIPIFVTDLSNNILSGEYTIILTCEFSFTNVHTMIIHTMTKELLMR